MKRITELDIERRIERLNQLTGAALEPYTKVGGGKLTANIGTYYLSGAYGGWRLEKIVNSRGGAADVLQSGFTTKRDLYNQLNSYIAGIETHTRD